MTSLNRMPRSLCRNQHSETPLSGYDWEKLQISLNAHDRYIWLQFGQTRFRLLPWDCLEPKPYVFTCLLIGHWHKANLRKILCNSHIPEFWIVDVRLLEKDLRSPSAENAGESKPANVQRRFRKSFQYNVHLCQGSSLHRSWFCGMHWIGSGLTKKGMQMTMRQILGLIDRAWWERISENVSRANPGSSRCAISSLELLFGTTRDIFERWWFGLLEGALEIQQAD
jgi:hypothetical protein